MHCHRHALCIQPGLQLVDTHGAVEVMGGVIFTRPHQLDWLAHGSGNFRRLHNEIKLNASAKATPQKRCFQADVFGLDAQGSRDRTLRTLLKLSPPDQQAFATGEVSGEIHGFHARVSLHGRDVLGLDGLGCTLHGVGHVADWLADWQHLATGQRCARASQHRVVVHRSTCALVPLHDQCLAGFLRLPVAACDHRHPVADLNHADDPGHALGRSGIKTLDLAADHRALLKAGVHHARQLDVDAELGLAVDFVRSVQAPGGFTHNREVFRIFQSHFYRHGQLGSGFGQLTISGFFAVGTEHHAVDCLEAARLNTPLLGSGTDKHFAHLGTALAQALPAVAHGG